MSGIYIHRRLRAFLRVLAVVSLFPGPGAAVFAAEPEKPDLPTAEELIEQCWEISIDLRSSWNTDDVRAGHLKTALCLEEAIIEYSSEFIDPDYLSRADIEKMMEDTRTIYGRFYWSLYNEHLYCPRPSCGWIYHSFHNTGTALLYEEILKNVMHQRHAYKDRPIEEWK